MPKNVNELCVLVVEDHGFQLEYTTSCLHQIGIARVLKAKDGQAGLGEIRFCESHNIDVDLVICDLQMPNMDGIEFLRILAEREFEGGIIIVTAMEAALVSAVSRMVNEYKLKLIGSIHKPIDTKTLIQYVSEVCESNQNHIRRPLPSGVEEKDIISALEKGNLFTEYQPQYEFGSGQLYGIEALARLRLDDGRVVYPDDFIHLYSVLGKTQEFETIVYRQAFNYLNSMIRIGKPIQLSINFCANMLGNDTFYHGLIEMARMYQIPHDLVTIEITERSLLKDKARSIEFLARLRLNGFKVSIDDFGTGYSSIKQLEHLPFNELKIDKSFVIGIEYDEQKKLIAQTITELAKRLNLKTIAEGVETPEAWNIMANFGCNICQGYLTGRPMAVEEKVPSSVEFAEYQSQH